MQPKEIYIKVTKDGPYLLYGIPKINEEIIISDEENIAIEYRQGRIFEIKKFPAALCRCGKTKNAPFCDGEHTKDNFDGTETASFEPVINNTVVYEGAGLILKDNEDLCASARFCDAKGTIWNLIFEETEEAQKEVIRQANLCPAGRFIITDKNGTVIEDISPQEISILEDEGLEISGPIWVKGSIRVESINGKSYEIRNDQTLCRCGNSKNKPFCDSAHCHKGYKATYKD
ncbi:MAG: CDGSH iron-sulfur domain-containing protein [Candidatus Gastranaerophilales bacterium]|nr:CDGSH iron-sulfur domain-containing protein [Candidatus Gastranaerophilales bacterium]